MVCQERPQNAHPPLCWCKDEKDFPWLWLKGRLTRRAFIVMRTDDHEPFLHHLF